jgi:hypothetical protein
MKNLIAIIFGFLNVIVFSQQNVFSISYFNQIGINQYNSIQNDYHNNDKIFSGYSFKNIGFSFDRQINKKNKLWLNFSMNIFEEAYKFDYYYLFSKPSHDPFNYLTEEDFINLPQRQKSSSYLQMIDFELSIKKTVKTSLWNLEVQPEIGLFTKSDFGLYDGFRYASIIIKEPYYYANGTEFITNTPSNNNKVFLFCSLNINKILFNKLQLGLDISYLPRIKMDYEVRMTTNISGFDSNGNQIVLYFNEINEFTKAQLVYDLFRFGLSVGYRF